MEKKRDGTDINVRETDKKMYAGGGEGGLPSEKPEIIFESLKCQVRCLLSETKQKLLDHWKMVWQCSFRDPYIE